MIVHSMGTKDEVRNLLKEGANTSITRHTSGFQHLLSSSLTTEQLRLAGSWWHLVAPGEELQEAHQAPTIFLSLQFTGMGDLPKFKCLHALVCFLTHGLFFQSQLNQTMHHYVSG